jgi:hypothetical protein
MDLHFGPCLSHTPCDLGLSPCLFDNPCDLGLSIHGSKAAGWRGVRDVGSYADVSAVKVL